MSSADSRRLVLHNDLAELQRLAAWIEGWGHRGVSTDVSFAAQLCLEEAVANVIMYGGASDERLEIMVEVERNGALLVARVVDNGREFDPTRVPAPSTPISLADAKVGDLGIHLMRSFASAISAMATSSPPSAFTTIGAPVLRT